MAVATDEIVELFERLPEAQRAEVADFARFLALKYASEADGDARWEAILADPRPRPKLEAFMRESLAEGGLEDLDPEKM
jgi:hypothetical protein